MARRKQPRTKLVVKVFPSVPKGIWLGTGVTRWLENRVFYREFQFGFTKALLLTLLVGALAGWAVVSLVLNYQSMSMARAYKAEAEARSQEARMAQRDYVSLYGRIGPMENQLRGMERQSRDIASVLGVDFGTLEDLAGEVDSTAMRVAAEELQARFDHLGSYLANQRDMLARTPSISPVKEKFWLTSRFGPRRNPFTATGGPGSRMHFHAALDMATKAGTPVYASADGTVEFSGRVPRSRDVFRWRYGNYIILDHESGFKTIYAHCKDLNVEAGQEVKRGDLIAWVGSTGRSTGPHLHYEVLMDGRPVNPAFYILDMDRDVRRPGAALKPDFNVESELYKAHMESKSR
jgi:murein DD-endopeptidase MepM/ murein hydrolase activator NlpD